MQIKSFKRNTNVAMKGSRRRLIQKKAHQRMLNRRKQFLQLTEEGSVELSS